MSEIQRFRALERKVNVLQRLAEVSVVLNATFQLGPLLTYLMDAAAEITESEGASVLLWDDQKRELRFEATTTTQAGMELIGQVVPLQGSLAGRCLVEGEIIAVNNTGSDPRHYAKIDEEKQFETRSLLVVPMRMQNRMIGVLEVVNKRHLPWTEDDRDYISVLAAQAAVAIGTVQMVTELQRANQELSELDKLKNDFIAIASHELRTPLAVILGYASFLKDEAEGRLGEHADKVLESGLQLRRIIEDLMNLRYLQQNASELVLEALPVSVVVQDALAEVESLLEASQHQVDVEIDPQLIVRVDRIRGAMAITNLLNNAIRFTPAGGSIRLAARRHDEASEIWLTIEDNGIGIDSTQLERIFEKFYQVEDHMTRKHGGLGIGLSIARALVEAHGGRIWASSAGLGQGAVFTIALPLAESTGT
ncbi:MAG: GAF domain-containing sensor histidine kinase [Anaerolineae bacterium]|nr:GAF domain-containing sensor histidine kinase [Anaerolineae bacterium]